MALNLRSLVLRSSAPYGSSSGKVNFYVYSSADAAATLLAAGYFNDARTKLAVNDVITAMCVASGVGDLVTIRVVSVPASGNVLVDLVSGDEVGGEARAVVPTSGGLTTGLLTATDTYIAVTSANADHIVTLPAIADVPLGKEIWGKNGGTAFEMRTPASSTTKINNGQADSNEAVVAANVSFMAKKTAADNWALLTFTGGAVACPTPD